MTVVDRMSIERRMLKTSCGGGEGRAGGVLRAAARPGGVPVPVWRHGGERQPALRPEPALPARATHPKAIHHADQRGAQHPGCDLQQRHGPHVAAGGQADGRGAADGMLGRHAGCRQRQHWQRPYGAAPRLRRRILSTLHTQRPGRSCSSAPIPRARTHSTEPPSMSMHQSPALQPAKPAAQSVPSCARVRGRATSTCRAGQRQRVWAPAHVMLA